jgi:hypothetical protein
VSDTADEYRRMLVNLMPDELVARKDAGEQVWDTETMKAEFEVLGFMAPFVVVKRRSDGVRGSLMFTHSPRWYFGWEEA